MKKKRRKLKWKNIIKLFLVIIFIILIISLITKGCSKSNFEVKLTIKSIEYGEEFKSDMIEKVKYKGKDVTDKIEYEFNPTKLGKNDLIIKYNNEKYKYKLNVVDTKKPEIELTGGDILLEINGKYQEYGYKAIDNYDGDITSRVEIKNNINTNKSGEYKVEYTVTDSSKNTFNIERKVTVTDKTPLDMSVKEFSLNGYYDNVLLKETNSFDDKYLKDFVFAGDSIPLYYANYDAITGHQIWNKNGINPETAKTSNININYGNDGQMLLVDAFKEYKPKYALLTLGSNSAGWMKVDYFISEYKELIEQIQEVSPDTTIIIQSIPPVDARLDANNSLNNKKINDYNYYLLKMCNELNLKFLNSAEALKDKNGTCKTGLCQEDGIHQTKKGIIELVLYLKNHYKIEE